ncbi:hypothetical protein JXB27_01365 [Candidatus Woesearchaeota archaeon]|nr:hypothetical protein [Candidatus Woesearchaeota archaeon]
MKKGMILLIAALVVLVACSSAKTIYPTQTEESTNGRAPVEARVQYSGTDYEKILQDTKTETEAKNDKTQELNVPMNFKKGNPGETVVFGFNLNSINQREGTYFYKVTFIKATDTTSNPIEVDKNIVTNWLAESVGSETVLEKGGSLYFPVIFTIGKEVKSGVPTVSGQYTFEVQIYKRDGSFEDKIDNLVKTIYLRVE